MNKILLILINMIIINNQSINIKSNEEKEINNISVGSKTNFSVEIKLVGSTSSTIKKLDKKIEFQVIDKEEKVKTISTDNFFTFFSIKTDSVKIKLKNTLTSEITLTVKNDTFMSIDKNNSGIINYYGGNIKISAKSNMNLFLYNCSNSKIEIKDLKSEKIMNNLNLGPNTISLKLNSNDNIEFLNFKENSKIRYISVEPKDLYNHYYLYDPNTYIVNSSEFKINNVSVKNKKFENKSDINFEYKLFSGKNFEEIFNKSYCSDFSSGAEIKNSVGTIQNKEKEFVVQGIAYNSENEIMLGFNPVFVNSSIGVGSGGVSKVLLAFFIIFVIVLVIMFILITLFALKNQNSITDKIN